MERKIFVDDNLREHYDSFDGPLVHRELAYEHIYIKNRKDYQLPFSAYQVHHKDGDKTNNSIENLQIVTKEEHDAIHGVVYSQGQRIITRFREGDSKFIQGNCAINRHKKGSNTIFKWLLPIALLILGIGFRGGNATSSPTSLVLIVVGAVWLGISITSSLGMISWKVISCLVILALIAYGGFNWRDTKTGIITKQVINQFEELDGNAVIAMEETEQRQNEVNNAIQNYNKDNTQFSGMFKAMTAFAKQINSTRHHVNELLDFMDAHKAVLVKNGVGNVDGIRHGMATNLATFEENFKHLKLQLEPNPPYTQSSKERRQRAEFLELSDSLDFA